MQNNLNIFIYILTMMDKDVNTISIQSTGLKRKTIDKYYTSPCIVNECIKLIKENINIQENDLCIEPSAGNGAFINGIKSLFKNYKFYDLEPENSEIIKQDYLEYDYNTINVKNFNKIHIIGNPPFGRQSSLAIKFIKKSIEYCDSISFILPKSFKKESLKKHFHLNFHLVYEYILPENSFVVDEKTYNVPCIFQIWIKKDIHRKVTEKIFPNKYKFVKKEEEHDISVRRVGINAGDVDTNTNSKSIQSHYFIKFENTLTDEIFNKLTKINYDCKHYTCGPKSISKQELIKEFNHMM
jgi:predicted RNA methylase